MRRLIESDLAATGQLERSRNSPVFFLQRRASHILRLQCFDLRTHIVTHQIQDGAKHFVSPMKQLPFIPRFYRMKRRLRWRKPKNKPASARINRAKPEHVAKERPVGFRILAVEKHVSASNH